MQPASVYVDESSPSVETRLCQLVHDLRQPLSNIQNCAAYLEMVLRGNFPAALAQTRMIERQVEEADCLLTESLAELRALLRQTAFPASGETRDRTKSITAAVT